MVSSAVTRHSSALLLLGAAGPSDPREARSHLLEGFWFFPLKAAFLDYNSNAMLSKCTLRWFLVYSDGGHHRHDPFQDVFITSERTSTLWGSPLHSLPSWPQPAVSPCPPPRPRRSTWWHRVTRGRSSRPCLSPREAFPRVPRC